MRTRLADIAGPKGLIGGPFGSSLVSSDYAERGIPVVRGGNMGQGRFIDGDFVYVSPEKVDRDLSRNTAGPRDILFTQRGTLGQVALVPAGAFPVYVVSQSQMRLRVDRSVAVPEYVYYASTAISFRKQIDDRAISTGVPHINLGILGQLEIPLPSLRDQQAIAEVLGAFDDKIAANTAFASTAIANARNEFLLAASAAAGGAVTFAEVATISGGGTPSTKNGAFWNGGVNWATPTDVTNSTGPYLESTTRTISAAGLAACSSRLFAPGAILMTSRATIGALAVNTVSTAVNQGFIVVEPHDSRLRWWLFHEMESRVAEFISWANGATFLELSRGSFKVLPVRMPSEAVLVEFSGAATALHDLAASHLAENRTLASARDALLPQLMSGKLRVRDAEQIASEAGA